MQKEPARQSYPKDVSEEEWLFVASYLCLLPEDCGQRVYLLREVFNALRYAVWAGCPWRALPHDLPPWEMGLSAKPALDQGGRLRSPLPTTCACSCA